MKKAILLSIIIISALSIRLAAQDESNEAEEQYLLHGGLFFGATTVTAAGGQTSGTTGLDLEFIIPNTKPEFGLGALFEMILSDQKEYIVGIPVFIHPFKGAKVWVAPAVAFSNEIENKQVEGEIDKFDAVSHSSPNFLFRFGAGYDFWIRHYSITPTICADIVESKFVLIYGITIGYAF